MILALIAAASVLILAVIGVNIGDVFARINQAIGLTENDVPPGTIEVTVLDNTGKGVAGISVFAFDDKGNWLGLYGRTDSTGVALFEEMNDGNYQFLAYQSPNYYWSQTISFPKQNQATIKLNVQKFTVSVVDGKGQGIADVYVYAYSANEQYWLGIYGRTGRDGQTTVELPDGDYKFRAYYRGQWYWSPEVNSPSQNSTNIAINQYGITVTVVDDVGQGVKENQLMIYGFSESGDYTGVNGKSNDNGRVKLEVSAGVYQFQVSYRSYDYWSELVSVPGTDEIVIKTEERPFTVSVVDKNGQPVKNVRIYAFTENDVYTGLNSKTNHQGEAGLNLPRGSFKFRADYKSQSFWSTIINTAAGSKITVTLN